MKDQKIVEAIENIEAENNSWINSNYGNFCVIA